MPDVVFGISVLVDELYTLKTFVDGFLNISLSDSSQMHHTSANHSVS